MRNTLGDTRTTNDDNTTQLDDTDFQYSNEIRNCRKIDNSNGETTSSNNDRPNSLLDNVSEEDKESFTNDDPDSLVENMTPNDKDSSNNNDPKSSNENESDNDSDSEQSDVSVHSDDSYNSKNSDYNSLDSEEEQHYLQEDCVRRYANVKDNPQYDPKTMITNVTVIMQQELGVPTSFKQSKK